MKITVGQLKKVIHSQLAEAKTAKQGEVKKINEVRKSSDAVVSAFLNQQNKRVSSKKSENGVLSLHNNPVAKYGENGGIWISDGGYGISATTAELLNNIPGVRVNIKNRAWMLDGKPWDGQWTKIDFAKFDAGFKSRSGTNESRKPSRNNVADYNQHHIAVDTVKNPNKSMFGGPSAEESEEILRNKFGYTDQEINRLKGVNESRISGEVKKINEVTFTKLIKKLIVEETEVLKSVKLNEGTGNFYNKNATHIFAFGMDTEDNGDDGEYNSDQHQIDYEDQISYIIEELSKIPGFSEGEYDFDDNRNFSGRSLGAISVNISNKNDTGVQIICVARSGYYEGANLDWELKFTGPDGYDIDSPDDISQRSYATKLQRAADALVKKVEKVYARCTTPYGVSARFSNGETMYHKIDGKKSK